MSAFDITLRVLDTQVGLGEDDKGKAVEARVLLPIGMILPIDLNGSGQLPIIPVGIVQFPLNKEAVEKLITQLEEVNERLETPSQIAVAHSLSGVDQAAKLEKDLRGNG